MRKILFVLLIGVLVVSTAHAAELDENMQVIWCYTSVVTAINKVDSEKMQAIGFSNGADVLFNKWLDLEKQKNSKISIADTTVLWEPFADEFNSMLTDMKTQGKSDDEISSTRTVLEKVLYGFSDTFLTALINTQKNVVKNGNCINMQDYFDLYRALSQLKNVFCPISRESKGIIYNNSLESWTCDYNLQQCTAKYLCVGTYEGNKREERYVDVTGILYEFVEFTNSENPDNKIDKKSEYNHERHVHVWHNDKIGTISVTYGTNK